MSKKLLKEEFIEKAKKVHGDKYDYSKVEYINARKKVCIICPEHGEFYVSPTNHCSAQNKCGCPKCFGKVFDIKDFINKAQKIHGDKYDYSKVEYKNATTKVCIICPEHGEFWQTPNKHLSGRGCPTCGKENRAKKRKKSAEKFITDAKQVHGDKYDYSKVEYVNNNTKVCIICPEHGEFWQTPGNHLRGKGCPACRTSHLEEKVSVVLEKMGVRYEKEKTFSWLKKHNFLPLDFYLYDHNIAIECQGKQHFTIVNFGGKMTIEQQQ